MGIRKKIGIIAGGSILIAAIIVLAISQTADSGEKEVETYTFDIIDSEKKDMNLVSGEKIDETETTMEGTSEMKGADSQTNKVDNGVDEGIGTEQVNNDKSIEHTSVGDFQPQTSYNSQTNKNEMKTIENVKGEYIPAGDSGVGEGSISVGGNVSDSENISKNGTINGENSNSAQESTTSHDEVITEVLLSYEYGDGICAIIKASNVSGDVILPDTTIYNGKSYKIVEISSKAFMDCGDITSITMGQYVDTISSQAFQNCKLLTKINFPSGLKTISYWAFNNCTSLNNVNIPAGTTVDSQAFINCPNLSY